MAAMGDKIPAAAPGSVEAGGRGAPKSQQQQSPGAADTPEAVTLHPAEQALRSADTDRDAARRVRDKAVRSEVAKGKSYRQVAAEFDLSFQRVAQIASAS